MLLATPSNGLEMHLSVLMVITVWAPTYNLLTLKADVSFQQLTITTLTRFKIPTLSVRSFVATSNLAIFVLNNVPRSKYGINFCCLPKRFSSSLKILKGSVSSLQFYLYQLVFCWHEWGHTFCSGTKCSVWGQLPAEITDNDRQRTVKTGKQAPILGSSAGTIPVRLLIEHVRRKWNK